MKILHFVPYFKLFPPVNGGALRSYNIAKELSKKYEVDLFLAQNRSEIDEKQLEGFGTINIYCPDTSLKTLPRLPGIAKVINAITYRLLTRQYLSSADGVFLSLLPVLKKALKHTKYDIVVFEHLETMLTAPFFRRHLPHAYFILDAHNVDHLLIKEENATRPVAGFIKAYERVKKYESSLIKFVDGYWACSEKDAAIFNAINAVAPAGAIIPNGVDTVEKTFIEHSGNNEKPALVFCGDLNTVANRSGIAWFIETIWPLLQRKYGSAVTLTIIGSGNENPFFEKYRVVKGIVFKGPVEDLKRVYSQSTISIAPLLVGSGTRLKILESMSFGIPVVATGKAAEGVAYKDGVHIMLADEPAAFYDKIVCLQQNKDLYRQIKTAGRLFVESNYDWSVIGGKMAAFISGIKRDA